MLEYTNMHILSDQLISETPEVPCQLQMFLEMEAQQLFGAPAQTTPLFISCPCKRCSPFTL